MKKEAAVMFHKDRFEKRYNDILKEIIKDLEGILYDFNKGYNVYESMKDLESAVIKLKKLND